MLICIGQRFWKDHRFLIHLGRFISCKKVKNDYGICFPFCCWKEIYTQGIFLLNCHILLHAKQSSKVIHKPKQHNTVISINECAFLRDLMNSNENNSWGIILAKFLMKLCEQRSISCVGGKLKRTRTSVSSF